MNIEFLRLFPIPVMTFGEFLPLEQCNDIIEYCRKLPTLAPHELLTNGAVSSHTDTTSVLSDIVHNIPSCKDLLTNLRTAIIDFNNESGFDGNIISNSWVNFQNSGSTILRHTHPGSCISGALYLKADDNSSKLHFYNPNPFLAFSHHTMKVTESTNNWFWVTPETGKLILFPSWLGHGGHDDVNQSSERVVLSFNTVL
jgi:hypothetical protein